MHNYKTLKFFTIYKKKKQILITLQFKVFSMFLK